MLYTKKEQNIEISNETHLEEQIQQKDKECFDVNKKANYEYHRANC